MPAALLHEGVTNRLKWQAERSTTGVHLSATSRIKKPFKFSEHLSVYRGQDCVLFVKRALLACCPALSIVGRTVSCPLHGSVTSRLGGQPEWSTTGVLLSATSRIQRET